MFLRRFQKRKNGKSHSYWALVETYRTAKGPRQRIVSYLGELKETEQSGWGQLATRLNHQNNATGNSTRDTVERVQQWLFDPPSQRDEIQSTFGSEPALVKLEGVRVERSLDFGNVWLAWGLWRMLGLDTLLSELMPRGKQEIRWYIHLTDAEWAFRITKDELVLRPIWHHKKDRVLAHILICFLAFTMWKTLAGWMARSGLGNAPRPLIDAFTKIKSSVLPVRWNGDGHELRIRCVTQPDDDQKLFLNRLGLALPKRLGSTLSRTPM